MFEFSTKISNNLSKTYFHEADSFWDRPFCCADAFVMRTYNVPMHAQAFWEVNIILCGTGTHYIEDQQFSVKSGDIFVIPPDFKHAYSSQGDFDVYHLILNKRFFSKYVAELNALPHYNTIFNIEPAMRSSGSCAFHLAPSEEELAALLPSLEELLHLTDHIREKAHPIFDEISAAACVLMIIAKMCALYEKQLDETLKQKPLQKDLMFLKSVSEIYNNFGGNLSTERLAAIAGRSRTSYIAHFKRILHMPPGQFILKYRLEKAEELIVGSNFPISRVAEVCGFYDLSHFEKSFFRAYGISPTAMRNGEPSPQNT